MHLVPAEVGDLCVVTVCVDGVMEITLAATTTPSDVANVIYLLSTDEAAWINGEVVRVDGGEHISGVNQ